MKQQLVVIFLHILFWTQNLARILSFSEPYHKTAIILEQLLIALMCYINYFLFVPYIVKKNDSRYYILWLFVFTTCFTLIMGIWSLYQTALYGVDDIKNDMNLWLNCLNISILYGAMSTGSRLALDWTHNQEKNKELLLQKTTAQIQLMKSNVNMPFLLQVLNYTEEISKQDPRQAEQPIMLISDVLRYGLYESESLSVSLSKEIEIIESYLELQKLISPSISTPLIVEGHTDQLLIVPNILLRIVAMWRAATDANEKSFNSSVHLSCKKDHLYLQLKIEPIRTEELKELTVGIQKLNNDHLFITCKTEASIFHITINSIV